MGGGSNPNAEEATVTGVTMRQLLEAGVHFGHQTRRWDPKMRPYIFTERNGIHIIDLRQTLPNLKYLFYVATAGKGEVPVRKAGGIRGFLRGGGGSGMSSRRESLDGQVEGEGKGLMLPPPLPVSKALNGSLNGALKKGYGNVQAGAMGKGSKLRDVG